MVFSGRNLATQFPGSGKTSLQISFKSVCWLKRTDMRTDRRTGRRETRRTIRFHLPIMQIRKKA